MSAEMYQQGVQKGLEHGYKQGIADAAMMRLWYVRNGAAVAIVRAINEECAKTMAASRDIRRDKEKFWSTAEVTEITQHGESMVILFGR